MSDKPRRWRKIFFRVGLVTLIAFVIASIWVARAPRRSERARERKAAEAHEMVEKIAAAAKAKFDKDCAMPPALARPTKEPNCVKGNPCTIDDTIAATWRDALGVTFDDPLHFTYETTSSEKDGAQHYTIYAFADLFSGPPAHIAYITIEGTKEPECGAKMSELTVLNPHQ